jgi:hypothetical protein
MLPRERVAAAFEHLPTDRIPIYQAGFSSQVASYVLGREAYVGGGIQQYREACALWDGPQAHTEFIERSFDDACELCEKLDLDLVRTVYWRRNIMPTRRVDEHTFVYGNPDGDEDWEVWRFDPPTETYGMVERRAAPEPAYEQMREDVERIYQSSEQYQPTPDDYSDYQQSLVRMGDRRAIPGTGVGISIPRERNWLEATVLHPEIVARYLDAIVIRTRKNVRVMEEIGLRYLFGGGDFAGNHGPFYSPRVFHELMLPRLKQISQACEASGVYHMFASDGDLWPVADDLFGASGVHAFYEVDRQFMQFRDVRARFPHLRLLGGIRSQVLHLGSPAAVVAETRTAVEDAHALGGCIVGCSNQIVAGTPEENFWAMMETLDRYR